ncbi:MAG: hypothetical protein FWD94_02300, partial [Treponema sp.]|nr:hypothetical protein [Treponema sp.]
CPALAPLPFAYRGLPAHVFGPQLSGPDEAFFDRVEALLPARRIAPTVLAAALTYDGQIPKSPVPPELSFRAAALAQLTLHSLPPGSHPKAGFHGHSLRWELGRLFWLPGNR